MNTITLTLEGMSCGHCVGRVKKTLERLGDVRIEDVQVGTARITLAGGPEALAGVLAALADAGYPARPAVA